MEARERGKLERNRKGTCEAKGRGSGSRQSLVENRRPFSDADASGKLDSAITKHNKWVSVRVRQRSRS